MTIKEVLEMFKNDIYEEVEVYEARGNYNHGIHSDFIKFTYEYSDNAVVLDYELMDEDRYNETIHANVDDSADFNAWYGDKNAKVLVVVIGNEIEEDEDDGRPEYNSRLCDIGGDELVKTSEQFDRWLDSHYSELSDEAIEYLEGSPFSNYYEFGHLTIAEFNEAAARWLQEAEGNN